MTPSTASTATSSRVTRPRGWPCCSTRSWRGPWTSRTRFTGWWPKPPISRRTGKSLVFELRPEAKFADGTALTSEDVCDSFRLLSTLGHENIRLTIKDVEACDEVAPHTVRYRFKSDGIRDLALSIAALPIFSKAYYTQHDFATTSLEAPLGSGPYKIKSYKTGEYVAYERRADYWARDLPVNRGRHNLDEVRFDYFRERTAGFEALKSGVIDLREEYTSRDWATAYDFPAMQGRSRQADHTAR